MSIKEFSGKVVLITGASSGIGRQTAIHFSKLGASLALTGRNLENLKKTEEKCLESPRILLIAGDLSKDNDIKKIIEATIQEFNKLDILVNNAGINIVGNLEGSKIEDFDKIFNTNVRAVFQLTQLAIPYLKTTKGNIVNVSSLAGLRSFPHILSYCMSKSALDQFTQCISLELAPHQVRVNSVNPAVIQTEIFQNIGMSEKQIEEYMERQKLCHPLGRIGQPEEVAEAIIFLASEKASFITGTLLPVTSGRHAACPN